MDPQPRLLLLGRGARGARQADDGDRRRRQPGECHRRARQGLRVHGAEDPVQRAAAAVYSDEGWAQTKEIIDYYMENARIIREGLKEAGFTVYGGINAPYIWLKTPGNLGSWDFFDKLLREANVVGTPGAGFGSCGEGYFRLSAFGFRENVEEAVRRIRETVGK